MKRITALAVDLFHSPIARSLTLILIACFVIVALFGAHEFNQFGAALMVSIGMAIFIVYAGAWWRSLRQQFPSAWHWVVVGVGSVASGFTLIRVQHVIWHDFDISQPLYDTGIYSLATMLVIFGGLCQLAAAGAEPDGEVGRASGLIILAALIGGALLAVCLAVLRFGS